MHALAGVAVGLGAAGADGRASVPTSTSAAARS